MVNRQFWKLLVDPLPPWEAILPDTPAETVRDIAGGFRSLLRPVPYQDAAPTLEAVKGQYRLGVLSNSPRPEQILSDLGLRHYFSAVVFPGDEARKPEPHAFSLICERMGVEARQAVNVGDTISHDVEGALAAGLRAVWVDRYGEEHPLPVGAVRIGSLRELPEALSRLD